LATVEQIGCDFALEVWAVDEELTVLEVADVNHLRGLLSELNYGDRNRKSPTKM